LEQDTVAALGDLKERCLNEDSIDRPLFEEIVRVLSVLTGSGRDGATARLS
jgi:hypothetical protein